METRALLDLPSELLLLILEHCAFSELSAARRVRPLRPLVRPVLRSALWRRRAANAAELQLQELVDNSFDGEALKGTSGGAVRCLQLQHDLLAAGSRDNVARVFGLRTSTCFAEFVHPHWVGTVALSPDSSSLATGCDDCCVRIWSLEPAHQSDAPVVMRTRADITAGGALVGLDWLDPSRLLSCSQSGALTIWDVRDGSSTYGESLNAGPVGCFDALGGRAAVAGCVGCGMKSHTLRHLVVREAGFAPAHEIPSWGPVASVSFDRAAASDGDGANDTVHHLVATGHPGKIGLWDLRLPPAQARVFRGLDGVGDSVRAVRLYAHLLVSAPAGERLSVWDLRAPRKAAARLRAHDNNDALALDAPRGRIACGGRVGGLRLFTTRF